MLAPGLRVVFFGINPGRVSAEARGALREPAQRLLAAAPRGALHPAALRAGRAVRAPRRGDRRHERRLPHDPRLRRPAPRRLRRLRRAARADRARPAPRLARVRRQGGLPRRVQRAARARPPGADARRDAALRPAVDLAGERRRAVVGSRSLVPRARRLASTGCPSRQGVRALVLDRDDRVLLARVRRRARAVAVAPGGGVEPGECDARGAGAASSREEVGLRDLAARPAALDARAPAREPAALGRPARSGTTSSASTPSTRRRPHEPTSPPRTSTRRAGSRRTSSTASSPAPRNLAAPRARPARERARASRSTPGV